MEAKDITFKTEYVSGIRYGMFVLKRLDIDKVCLSRIFKYEDFLTDEGLKDIHDMELLSFKKGVKKHLNA